MSSATAVKSKRRIHRRHRTAASQPAPPAATTEDIGEIARLMRLLGDQHRLAIVCRLRRQPELNVGQLSELTHQSQPAVSHHLAIMRKAGLIECRRDGRHRYYRLRQSQWQRAQALLGVLASDSAPEKGA